MVVNSQILITAVSVIGTIIAGMIAVRGTRRNAEITASVERLKIEANSKAEILRNQTSAETKRIDQVLEGQQKFIETLHAENEYQRKELAKLRADLEALRLKYEAAAEERTNLVIKLAELRSEYEKVQHQYDLVMAKVVVVKDKPPAPDLKTTPHHDDG